MNTKTGKATSIPIIPDPEEQLVQHEIALRAWFTRDADEIQQVIDGLDIGWGGAQRWGTRRMYIPVSGLHLDFACGYGTFLAQLGWRFPSAQLVGLNFDFEGPHALIGRLLKQADVQACLVQADARYLPFKDGSFTSVSCFLGLQDIEIGFGQAGMRMAAREAIRVLQKGCVLYILDNFSCEKFTGLFDGLPADIMEHGEFTMDVHWDRQVAEHAIALYTEGWVAQARPSDSTEWQQIYEEVFSRLKADMEQQLMIKGYYEPFGPIRMVTLRKPFS